MSNKIFYRILAVLFCTSALIARASLVISGVSI